ncbi:MAG: GAF domain-containing protein, partial [Anaerolineales bacterium]|nr:GAF domain-containing protein [Anaerolineales bacterium]
VVVELPQADIFAGINALAPFLTVLLIATMALVLLSVPFATGRAIRPLVTLSSLAEQIARGEWRHRVPVGSQDEIGRLGTSFNRMIDELEESYRSLEDRVHERTEQIRTASEVARDAIAIREPETLLNEVVHLISERFGFYHAGVFLVDGSGENAVLRAASSEGGKHMLRREHSLPVGKVGIVGYVTGTGEPRIALDVGEDAYHFANPDLPDTRSEMALPLRSGEEIIGALDVQSTEANAFTEEDLMVLQTMSDQLAVAIENARLLEDQALLAERRRTVIDIYHRLATQLSYSQLLEEIPEIVHQGLGFISVSLALVEGDEVFVRSSAAKDPRYQATLGDSMPIGRGIYGRVVSMKSPIVMVGTTQSDFSPADISPEKSLTTLCVPLLSRGEAIGALAVTSDHPSHPEERDLEVLELLSGQIAVALINARLFEEMEQSLLHVDALLHQQTSEAWDELLDTLSTREEGTVVEYTGGF